MNILICRLGGVWKFFSGSDVCGGDAQAKMFIKQAELHPEHNFYFVGGGDLEDVSRSTRFIPTIRPSNTYSIYLKKTKTTPLEYLIDNCDIHFDYAIVHPAMKCSCWMNDMVPRKDGNGNIHPLLMAKVYGPIVYYINEMQIPYSLIIDDPRVFPLSKDFKNAPDVIYSQGQSNIQYSHITSYNDVSTTINDVPEVYSKLERCYLIGKTKPVNTPKLHASNDLFLPMHLTKTRARHLRNWTNGETVFGKVVEYGVDTTGINLVNKLMKDIDTSNYKYTLVLPVTSRTNFVTQKVTATIYDGLVPFIPSTIYDTDKILGLPDELYVSSKEELYDRINTIDYESVFAKCQEWLLKDEYFNGTYWKGIIK